MSYDGRNVWAALGVKVVAFDPASGDTLRTLDLPGDAGTALDGNRPIMDSKNLDPASGSCFDLSLNGNQSVQLVDGRR